MSFVQVLQLPGHLAATAFMASGVKLDTCLAHLPPCIHRHACEATPQVITQGELRVDASCYSWTRSTTRQQSRSDCSYVCVADQAVLCSLLKAAANFTKLHGLHLDVSRSDDAQSYRANHVAPTPHGAAGASDLAAAFRCTLEALSQLKALSVGGVFAHFDILSGVADALPGLPLEELSISGAEEPVAMCPVATSLGRCTNLTSLQLAYVSEPVAGSERSLPFSMLLDGLRRLRHLSLVRTVISAEGAVCLSQGLVCLTELRSINMQHCRFKSPTDDPRCGPQIRLVHTLAALSTMVHTSSPRLLRCTCRCAVPLWRSCLGSHRLNVPK